MIINLTYKGIADGVSFSPTYPLMFVNAFKKLGIDAKIKRTKDAEFNGFPADNYFSSQYDYAKELYASMSGMLGGIKFRDLEINFSDLDVVPQVCGTTTSAGCKYKCKFCPNKKIEFLERPKDKVLRELDWLVKQGRYFEFFDNNVLLSRTFLNIVPELPPASRWGALINITKITDKLKKNLATMYKHGCRNIYLGLESFNNKDLIYFGKPYVGKVDSKEFMKMLQDIGFNVYAFIIRGLPNDTPKDFQKMTNYLKKHNILYGISRFEGSDGIVESTKFLSREFLIQKGIEDTKVTRENLIKFINSVE